MRAWRVERITEDGELLEREIAVPQPDADHYLVKVEGAGIVFGDTLLVRGKYQVKPPLPFTLGSEVVGTIVAGDGGPLPVGTRVVSGCRQGGFADYALVPRSEPLPLDAGFDCGTALAMRGNYSTSLYSLRNAARLQAGETLLVHAGAGGVGSAAVQLGKMMGARVIATAGGEAKVKACLQAGADEALDYTNNGWVDVVRTLAPSGVDVIYDPVGGDIGAQSLRCLAYGARYLVIGFAGGTLTALPANRLLLHNASAIGVLWGEARKRQPELAAQMNREIYEACRDGRLKPLVGKDWPFGQAREALASLANRDSAGKVWLRV